MIVKEMTCLARGFLSRNAETCPVALSRVVRRLHQDANEAKKVHPYRNIHPWKSRKEFVKYLVDNVLYNNDGIVALNKPYGISAHTTHFPDTTNSYDAHRIVHPVNYTLADSLPEIAAKLGHGKLEIVKTPEKYCSGVTLLAGTEGIKKAIHACKGYAHSKKILCETYWAVTTKCPNQRQAEFHVGVTVQRKNVSKGSQLKMPVILQEWSKSKQKNQEVKPARIEFNTICNSTLNLSSLIEVKLNVKKWHLLRLFASTMLFSPILGDNIHGSRIQKLQGTWVLVDPFNPVVNNRPTLDSELLRLLRVSKGDQDIIPVHVHLKSHLLTNIFRKEDILIEAPLLPPFDWTCEQLQFKIPHEREEAQENVQEIAY